MQHLLFNDDSFEVVVRLKVLCGCRKVTEAEKKQQQKITTGFAMFCSNVMLTSNLFI